MTDIGTGIGKVTTQYPMYCTRLHMIDTNACGLIVELLLLSNKIVFHFSEKKAAANQLCHHS